MHRIPQNGEYKKAVESEMYLKNSSKNLIMKETVVLSVGGSLVAPNSIDTAFLKQFITLIAQHKEKRFILVVGGGAVCRTYQSAAKELVQPTNTDLDWIGVMATRMNAELLRVAFGAHAYHTVITDPRQAVRTSKQVIVASGWKPGWSSDYIAVLLATKYKAKTVLNLSNIDYVYDKDPKLPGAKPYEQLSWNAFQKIVGTKWNPGANTPFDPIATKSAAKLRLRVVILNGRNIENLKKILAGKPFVGTTIE
jgi:uridylate kinase